MWLAHNDPKFNLMEFCGMRWMKGNELKRNLMEWNISLSWNSKRWGGSMKSGWNVMKWTGMWWEWMEWNISLIGRWRERKKFNIVVWNLMKWINGFSECWDVMKRWLECEKVKKNISMNNWAIPVQVNHCTAVMVEPTWRFLATGQWMAPSIVFTTDANKSTRDPVPFVTLNKFESKFMLAVLRK